MVTELNYKLRQQTEWIAGIPIEVECLENLDHTIDELFRELEKSGNESLLEDLCPYFGQVWPSARSLAEEVAAKGAELRGRKLLELGCGLAIPSMVAAKLGAVVTATDFHPEVPIFLRRNLAHNRLAGVEYIRVDWRTGFPELGSFDYVIGSDVLYERAHAPQLAGVIERYLAPKGLALVADPARPYLQEFVDSMTRKGFRHETWIHSAPDAPKPKDVFLVSLSRR